MGWGIGLRFNPYKYIILPLTFVGYILFNLDIRIYNTVVNEVTSLLAIFCGVEPNPFALLIKYIFQEHSSHKI